MGDEQSYTVRAGTIIWIGTIAIELANQLVIVDIPYDRHSTRFFIELYDFLSQIDEVLIKFAATIEIFQSDQRIGWKVHYIYEVGKILDELRNVLVQLNSWIYKKQKQFRALKVWTESLTENSNRLNHEWQPLQDFMNDTNRFKELLQANDSPNPKLFSSPEIVSEIAEILHNLRVQATTGRQLIHDFAIARLKVSDFFK